MLSIIRSLSVFINFYYFSELQMSDDVARSAGVILPRECTLLYKVAILDLVTVEGWGEGKFGEGVGVK